MPDLAEATGLQRVEFVVRLVQVDEHHARVADHGLAVPGGLHAARQPVEQRHLQHVLQFLEQLGRGRLRHVEHLRRAVDVAFLGQRDQQQQLPSLEPGTDEPVVVVSSWLGFIPNAWIDIHFVRKIDWCDIQFRFLDSAARHGKVRLESRRAEAERPALHRRPVGDGRHHRHQREPVGYPRSRRRVRAGRPQPDRTGHPRGRRGLRAVGPERTAAPRRRARPDRQRDSARKEELGKLLAREEGKTLPEAVGEVARAGQIFKFFAGEAWRIAGETHGLGPARRPGRRDARTGGRGRADLALELSRLPSRPGRSRRPWPTATPWCSSRPNRCRSAAGRWPRSSAAAPCRPASSTW